MFPTRSKNRRVGRRFLPYALIGIAGLALVTGRVLFDAAEAIALGDAASAEGAEETAITHYHHGVRMYVPGSPYTGRALERLRRIATGAAARGDVDAERAAVEAIRSGLLGARSFYTPYADDLADADRRLAKLYATIEPPGVDPGASLVEREAWHAAQLARRPGPHPLVSLLALLGLGLWVGAVVLFVRRGLDRDLVVQPRWALRAGVALALGLTLFVVGLRLA